MAGTKDHVVCVLCQHNQIMKKQTKGLVEFRRWNPKDSDFIQVRDYTGGRTKDGASHGFAKVSAMTLHDAVSAGNADYDEVLKRMREQLLVIVQAFVDEGVITKTELSKIK